DELLRFRLEAELLAQLHHPNIVQVYEVGTWEGRPYFSMELVDGGSLAERIQKDPPSPAQAGALVEVLARAIHAAHERHIIHRDLKPANVLLVYGVSCLVFGGEATPPTPYTKHHTPNTLVPKITDFGLAKHLQESAGPTPRGAVLGTPAYMAPEQAGIA